MRPHIKKSQLLKKYVIYNLCLVLIPLLILIGVYYHNAQLQIIQEYGTAKEYALTQTMRSVDNNLQSFSSMALRITYDEDLTPYQLRQNNYDSALAIRRLGDYQSNVGFMNEVFLKVNNEGNFYTGSGIRSMDTFARNYRFLGSWDLERFQQILEEARPLGSAPNGCFLQRTNDRSPSLLVTYPWSRAAGTSFGCVSGLISVDYFESLLHDMQGDLDEASFILDQEGQVLFSLQKNTSYTDGDIAKVLAQTKPGLHGVNLNGDCTAILLASETNGWQYLSIFPNAQFNVRLLTAQTPFIIAITVLLVACIVVGILMAFRHYMPVYRLFLLLRHNNGERGKSDEFQEIGKSIRDMAQQNENMSRQLDESRAVMAEQLLQKVFAGTAGMDAPLLKEKMEALGLPVKGPKYCAAMVKPTGVLAPNEKLAALAALSALEGVCCTELDYKNSIAVLINLSDGREFSEKTLPALMEGLSKTADVVVGVGQTYSSLGQVSRSMTEAEAAAEAGHMKYGAGVVRFDELPTRHQTGPYWYPPKAQLRLLQGLQQGNRPQVEESLESLRQTLLAQALEPDPVRMQFTTNSLIQQLWPLADEAGLESREKDIDQLIRAQNPEHFMERLQNFCGRLLWAIDQKKTSEQGRIFDQVLSYIDAHYCEQGISLSNLADMFNMTNSYLSRFFRDHSGVNFIDYLTEKRMKKASVMLKDTDLRIREIMEQVGYLDLASFTRKFTQIFGISPGRYRSED